MLDELKRHYVRSLHGKIDEIRTLLKAVRAGDEAAENSLRVLAHSQHGSGSTYGFPDISKAARDVEHATHYCRRLRARLSEGESQFPEIC
jgi:chemotaxis protein histidine kinase CheA